MHTSISTLLALALSSPLFAQTPGEVTAQTKLSALTGVTGAEQAFGGSAGALGDLDGDGVEDLIAGAFWDDTGGPDRGAAHVIRLNADGTVKSSVKVVSGSGGIALDDFDYFGTAAAGIGDVDGDGIPDAAVGASGDDDGLGGPSSNSVGALWILFLNADGTVKGSQKISATAGGLVGPVEQFDNWFSSVAGLGDVDGDGTPDIAVGVQQDDDGFSAAGAIYVLYLNADGTVKAEKKISATQGGFGGTLHAADLFGSAIAVVGDLDGNGSADLAVGASGDDDGKVSSFASVGAVWILFLDANEDVIAEQKISKLAGGFTGDLEDNDLFGVSLAAPGDVDGDGVRDVVIGAYSDDGTGPVGAFLDYGAIWVTFLNADGTVKGQVKIGESAGGLAPGTLSSPDFFGRSIAALDLDGDGHSELAVGASGDDEAGSNAGAVYMLFVEGGASSVSPLGCGVNPPGSLVELGGVPAINTTWTLGVENPLGTQPPGSSAFVAVAIASDPATPCGTVLPGFGMASGGANGELLISVLAPNPVVILGPVAYAGVGTPAPVALTLPNDPTLPGVSLYVQGSMLGGAVVIGLSDGFEAVVQP